MISEPYPELDDILEMMGEAGSHLAEMEASEGAAGNISVCIRWRLDPRTRFPVVDTIDLPQPVPELAGLAVILPFTPLSKTVTVFITTGTLGTSFRLSP